MGLDRLGEQVDKEARDLTVLAAVLEHGPIGSARLSEVTDVPEHKVRHSLRMLEDDGLVEVTADDAVAADDAADRLDGMNDGLDDLADRVADLKEIFETDGK
ncbi:helix-turn-helix domain-containing protein [Halomicrobium salinisoli]|uniref:helix-turn-helix domain-containing protein n=1 Tax=Halomicrobium salinisoli TaxID=2878391 RepID=UPI001CEFCF0C|nr:helix-turn-helix domain-containing protein [Halomicrobium salinisoli]